MRASELHQVDSAVTLLKALATNDGFDCDEDYLYALARVNYFLDDLDNARLLFEKIYSGTSQLKFRFKSLLGIGNIYLHQKNFAETDMISSKLRSFEPLEDDGDKISLLIFFGNLAAAGGEGMQISKAYFFKALKKAVRNGWSYYTLRCLYGLASMYRQGNQKHEEKLLLSIIQTCVDEDEARYFSYLVNRKFGSDEVPIRTQIDFDRANMRILVHNRWLTLHDKPILFQFLLLLHERDEFVSKTEIAKSLWSEEDYRPRVHDPRIADIAKRLRALIETFEEQPLIILSNRMGYRLAST